MKVGLFRDYSLYKLYNCSHLGVTLSWYLTLNPSWFISKGNKTPPVIWFIWGSATHQQNMAGLHGNSPVGRWNSVDEPGDRQRDAPVRARPRRQEPTLYMLLLKCRGNTHTLKHSLTHTETHTETHNRTHTHSRMVSRCHQRLEVSAGCDFTFCEKSPAANKPGSTPRHVSRDARASVCIIYFLHFKFVWYSVQQPSSRYYINIIINWHVLEACTRDSPAFVLLLLFSLDKDVLFMQYIYFLATLLIFCLFSCILRTKKETGQHPQQ